MMPRKKRLTILITTIILIVGIIIGVLAFLYLKTDAFKSNETLFAKYLMQNFNAIDNLANNGTEEITNALNTNKYTSELVGKIEYVENVNTSDENKDNPINNMQVKINSQTDKNNKYYYKDIKVTKDDENLMRTEYLNQENIYGIRLDGIKQFVSIDSSNLNNIQKDFNNTNLEGIFTTIDFNGIFNFSQEEKQKLSNTYLEVMKNNISKDKYYKQSNNLITVNNKDVYANAYYMKLTREEYNDLKIKMLEQLSKDEVILSKIDKLEETIKEKDSSYNEDKKLRDSFKEYINDTIEDIKNNNIGSDEVKITVYENKGQTVRTSIEMNTNKLNIDLFNNAIKLEDTVLGETENKKIIKVVKDSSSAEQNIDIAYEEVEDSEVVVDLKITNQQKMEGHDIKNDSSLEVSNDKCKVNIEIQDTIKIVNEFEQKNDFENDNVNLNELDDDKVETIVNILISNIQGQFNNFNENIPVENFVKLLQDLNLTKKGTIQISDKATVTETEKNRFNSQFEFFASENLTKDNIKELLNVTENDFKDMKIILNGQESELDTSKLEGNSSRDYINNIEEIDLYIKENQTNENKKTDLLAFLEKSSKKYDVSLEYNEQTGLVEMIKIKIRKD